MLQLKRLNIYMLYKLRVKLLLSQMNDSCCYRMLETYFWSKFAQVVKKFGDYTAMASLA